MYKLARSFLLNIFCWCFSWLILTQHFDINYVNDLICIIINIYINNFFEKLAFILINSNHRVAMENSCFYHNNNNNI